MIPSPRVPLAHTNEDAFEEASSDAHLLMHNKDVDPSDGLYTISKNFARWYAAGCAFKYMRRRGIRVYLSKSWPRREIPYDSRKEKGKAAISGSPTRSRCGAKLEEPGLLIVSLADERCGHQWALTSSAMPVA